MFRRSRIRSAHRRFLESSRVLHSDHRYWSHAHPISRKILELVSGGPLLGMRPEGTRLWDALDWLEKSCTSRRLDRETVRHYHRTITGDRSPDAGCYRTGSMQVTGSRVARPAARLLAPLLESWEHGALEEQEKLDRSSAAEPDSVLMFAVAVHQQIALIHPFEDGNGRVARLAMNHVLRRYGLGYVILPPINDSREHFEVLEQAHLGDLKPMIALCRKHLVPV